MALIEIIADLKRTALALERIAQSLEGALDIFKHLLPLPTLGGGDQAPYQAQISDLHQADAEHMEQVSRGVQSWAERHGVMADSAAFESTLAAYTAEMRRLYGEDWQPDWDTIFAQISSQ